METIDIAKEVIDIEVSSLIRLREQLTPEFEKSVQLILATKGKLIVTGMGKSGLIGRKLAATFASTGTSSFFLHPGEAYHGDLGMIDEHDIVLAISYSGETDEILKLIPFLKENGNVVLAMTGNGASALAKNAHAHLNIFVEKEACPYNLTPTASSITCLAMGDALAIALMKIREFKPENFARFHPGGSLGKRLISRVDEIMQKDNLPLVKAGTNVKEIIHVISRNRLGLAIIVNENRGIAGVITDGDIRRAMENQEEAFFTLKAEDFPTKTPKTISSTTKLVEAERLMNQHKINSLLVEDEGKLTGVVQIYDIV